MKGGRGHAVFLVVATVAAAVLLLLPSASLAGTQATTNACLSNATATYSDLVWTLTGSATPKPATVGSNVTLSGSSVTVAIPATLLIAGYNLGLLTVGPNSIPTTVYVARQATNASTAGAGQTQVGANVVQVDNFTATVTTTITDPNGVPGTGDESATPLNVNQPLPDMVVTATGGTVAFSQGAPGTLGSLPLGTGGAPVAVAGSVAAQASVAGGLVKARFDCQAGTTIINPPGGTSGTTFTPATAAPFETVTVSAVATTTTAAATTTTAAATTTTAAATTTTSGATTTTMVGGTTTTAAATTTTVAATTTTSGATTTTAAATTTTKPATTTTAAATTTTKPATTTTAAATTTTKPATTTTAAATTTTKPATTTTAAATTTTKPATTTTAAAAITTAPATTTTVAATTTTKPATTTTTVAATTTVKPATATTVAAATGAIPKTGPRQLIGQLVVALVLLDLGYLALSLLRPPKRRTLG